jgi:hypothetical protein
MRLSKVAVLALRSSLRPAKVRGNEEKRILEPMKLNLTICATTPRLLDRVSDARCESCKFLLSYVFLCKGSCIVLHS